LKCKDYIYNILVDALSKDAIVATVSNKEHTAMSTQATHYVVLDAGLTFVADGDVLTHQEYVRLHAECIVFTEDQYKPVIVPYVEDLHAKFVADERAKRAAAEQPAPYEIAFMEEIYQDICNSK
jgi:hypothetical protein